VGLIKTRPKIQLILPTYAHPGTQVIAKVNLETRRKAPIEFIHVTLIGREVVTVPVGNSAQRHRRELCGFEARLFDDTTLRKGKTSRSCTFDLPQSLPPTHGTRTRGYNTIHTSVDYVVHVHCKISWWPDVKRAFVLNVAMPPTKVVDAGPTVHTSRLEGPSGKEPHVEFSLRSSVVAAGETLRGELALSNVDFVRYKVALLSIVGYEKRFRSQDALIGQDEVLRYSIKHDISTLSEGEPFAFGMKLPEDVPPTFTSVLWDLRWVFEVQLEVSWSDNLTAQVPISVVPRGSQRKVRQQQAVPTIGSQRLTKLWTAVAMNLGMRFDEVEQQIETQIAETKLVIRRQHRGGDGIFLQAELTYPSLGLDIDGGLASSLRRMVGGGAKLGDAKWDKRHYFGGREEEQIDAFARSLRDHLLPVSLADIDDEHMVIELRDAGQSRKVLTSFSQHALVLAKALPSAIQTIPAPALMMGGLRAWQRIAKRLGGKLRTTNMSVRGRFDGVEAVIESAWTPDGKARHTAFTIQGPNIAAEKNQLSWNEQYLTGDPATLSKKAKTLLESMFPDAIAVTIETDHLVLWDARAPMKDDKLMVARFEQLAALAAALQAQGGPYR
jgi:hypothetical protein